jgi:hypothetical protein
VQRQWRIRLIMLRLHKLLRGLRVCRRLIFWWRLHRRILVKRRALESLTTFLREASQSHSRLPDSEPTVVFLAT